MPGTELWGAKRPSDSSLLPDAFFRPRRIIVCRFASWPLRPGFARGDDLSLAWRDCPLSGPPTPRSKLLACRFFATLGFSGVRCVARSATSSGFETAGVGIIADNPLLRLRPNASGCSCTAAPLQGSPFRIKATTDWQPKNPPFENARWSFAPPSRLSK